MGIAKTYFVKVFRDSRSTAYSRKYRYEIRDETGLVLIDEGGFYSKENAEIQARRSLKDLQRDDWLNRHATSD